MLKESIDLHRQGRLDEAEQGYRARLAEQPNDVDALHLLGLLRHQRGDLEEGVYLLTRAHELAPEEAGIEASLATLHFREGDYTAAQAGYQRALALDPNLGGAHSGIGQIALLSGDSVLAEQHFRIALRAGEDAQALAGLGGLLLERGDLDAALRHLGRAADLAPDDAMVQLMLGQAFARRDTPAFAEQAFANALRLQPQLHQARSLLGALLIRAKRPREAEPYFQELLSAPGLEATAYVGLADAARADNRLEEAVASYRAALAIDPVQSMPTQALAWTLAQLGSNDEAIAAYDGYLSHAPNDRAVHSARADLLTLLGRLPEAAAAWQALSDGNPGDWQVRSRLALVEERLGRTDVARQQAELVLRASPDEPDMLLLRVRALLRAGDGAAARVELERLGQRSLSESQTRLRWNYLGQLHDRADEAVDAARCFVEAQRGSPSAMPPLAELRPELQTALTEPVGEAWPLAPILLLGTPGSGVERVAALLADQPQLIVLRDRFRAAMRADDFNLPRFAHYTGALSEEDRAALRERYLAPLHASNIALDRTIVDWLPRWDAHLLALVRRVMPGTRLVIVERDPRDALLNWLAFGWAQGFPCAEPDAAAEWLARARRHLHFGADLDEPKRLLVAADALLDDAQGAGIELARFVGVDALRPGAQFAAIETSLGGLPTRFGQGHWQHYRDALATAFQHLQ